jgi:hypothetical protein
VPDSRPTAARVHGHCVRVFWRRQTPHLKSISAENCDAVATGLVCLPINGNNVL